MMPHWLSQAQRLFVPVRRRPARRLARLEALRLEARDVPATYADGVESVAAFQSSAGIDTLDQDVEQAVRDLDVTRDLQAWSAGAANFGWMMTPWNNGTDGWAWDTAEVTTLANRPKLTVE